VRYTNALRERERERECSSSWHCKRRWSLALFHNLLARRHESEASLMLSLTPAVQRLQGELCVQSHVFNSWSSLRQTAVEVHFNRRVVPACLFSLRYPGPGRALCVVSPGGTEWVTPSVHASSPILRQQTRLYWVWPRAGGPLVVAVTHTFSEKLYINCFIPPLGCVIPSSGPPIRVGAERWDIWKLKMRQQQKCNEGDVHVVIRFARH